MNMNHNRHIEHIGFSFAPSVSASWRRREETAGWEDISMISVKCHG